MNAIGLVVFALWVGAILAASSLLLERALTTLRLPIRWTWIGALLLSSSLPLMAFLSGPRPSEMAAPLSVGSIAEPTDAATAMERTTNTAGATVDLLFGWWAESDRVLASGADLLPQAEIAPLWIGGIWAAASFAVALVLGTSFLRLRRRARRWPEEMLHEREVNISPNTGPATVGLRRPRIVIPRWARSLPDSDLELILLHEEEHVRAHDTLMLAVGLAAVALCPWSPLVWWKMRRLNAAVEVDCDRRVLRAGIAPARYGKLLVSMGTAHPLRSLAVATIVGSTSLLERRLILMKSMHRTASIPAVFAMTSLALVLLVVACSSDAILATEPSAAAHVHPVAEPPLLSEAPSDDDVVAIWIDGEGAVQVNGESHPLDRLSEVLTPLFRREVIVAIEAHEAAPYSAVFSVQEQLRAAGFRRVVFIAVDEEDTPSASRDPEIVVEQGFPVVLPDSTMLSLRENDAAQPNLLYLAVRPEGAVVLTMAATSESQTMTRGQVEGAWRHLVGSNANLIGLVQTHPDAPYGFMYEVLEGLQRAEATRFALELLQ